MSSDIIEFKVNGWPLALLDGNPERRIHDKELGRRAGLSRARDIRKAIKRLEERGRLPGIVARDVVARGRNQHGETVATYSVREYWPNRREALVIVNDLETPMAVAIQDEMIDAFLRDLDGSAPRPATHPIADVSAIVQAVVTAIAPALTQAFGGAIAKIQQDVSELQQRDVAIIRPWQGKDLLRQIREEADRRYRHGLAKSSAAEGTRIRNRVAAAAKHFGSGRSWDKLPNHRYGDALAELDAIRKETTAVVGAVAASRQTELPLDNAAPVDPTH